MKKHLLLFAVAIFTAATPLFAQQEMLDTAAFNKIRTAELKDSHIPEIAHYLTDVSGPRLTNSPGFFRAANYVIETMKKWGLTNVGLEPWGAYGRGWQVENFSISMRSPYYQGIIGYAEPWSSNTNGEVHGEVFILNFKNFTDSAYYAQHMGDFKGKIIMLTNDRTKLDGDFKPFSTRLTDSDLANLKDFYMVSHDNIAGMIPILKQQDEYLLKLKEAGALAMLTATGHFRDGTVQVQSFLGYKIGRTEVLPLAIISAEDGFKIKRLIKSGQQVELNLDIKGKFYDDDTKGYNVIGEIPGSDTKLKAQVVMLGGHLDSWTAGTGATDNGAGCMVMMEAVRLLDSLHLQPKRTIRIALWSGEEEGVLGSYNYVKNHFGDAETGALKPEQAQISAYFNLDNGTGKIRGVWGQGNAKAKAVFDQWLVPFHDLGATTVTLHSTGSTDHQSFDWIGIPAFQFIQDPLDYETKTHHTNMDTYDFLQMDDLKQAAIIVASFVYQASIRLDMLPRKPIVKEKYAFDGL